MVKKKKILFLSHSSGLYGSEKCLLALLKNLNKEKYLPLVIVPYNGPLCGEIEQLGVEYIVYPLERWVPFRNEYGIKHFLKLFLTAPKRLWFLKNLIKREGVDLVYTNSILQIDGVISAKMCGIPHITHVHNNLRDSVLRNYFPIPWVYKTVKKLSSVVILVSQSLRDTYYVPETEPANPKKVIIHNGVDTDKFRPPAANKQNIIRQRLGLSEKTFIVALICRYVPHKRQDLFIDAAKIVSEKSADCVFVMIGSGDDDHKSKLERQVKEYGIEKSVLFLGYIDDIVSVYRSIDILVSAADFEAFGLSIIEGMASGKPVVATKSGGPQEIIEEGETGFLVPVGDAQAMAGAILHLLMDDDLRHRMGQEGRKRVEKEFSLDVNTSRIEEVIERLL